MGIQIKTQSCTGCSYCTVTCPVEAIQLEINQQVWPVIDDQICTGCGTCITICPNNVFSDSDNPTRPAQIDDEYDVIIIGAGIGGLMTAAGLARAGKKVLVVEQLSFAGGKYTHLTTPDGYAINTAAWTCPGPNSRIGKLCTQLGAQIRWITVHEVPSRGDHWIILKDGRRFTSTDEAQYNLVGKEAGMVQVYRWMADMYDPANQYPDEMTARQYIQKFVPNNPDYEKYVETIITHCFASQTVDHFSAMETKRAIVDAIEQMADWGTAEGGVAAIIQALVNTFQNAGGKLVLQTRVASILIGDNAAYGVQLADGRSIRSGIVIHNAGIQRFLQLVGEDRLPAGFADRLQSVVPANVGALVLCTQKALLGDDHSLLHSMGWDRTLNCYAPTFFDPGLAPQGNHILDVFWVMQPPYDHAGELQLVMDELHDIFPDLDDWVVKKVPMFYTGGWTAEMAHRMGQSGSQRLDPQTPISNLYMVGYDCIGYGMAGDIIPHGVQRVLYLILGDPAFKPPDDKPTRKAQRWLKANALRTVAAIQSLKLKNS